MDGTIFNSGSDKVIASVTCGYHLPATCPVSLKRFSNPGGMCFARNIIQWPLSDGNEITGIVVMITELRTYVALSSQKAWGCL